MPRRSGEAHLYRLGHPLAEQVLNSAKARSLPPAEITFYYAESPKVSTLEPYIGQQGELLVILYTIESLDQAEDYLLFTAITDSGVIFEEDIARRLLSIPVMTQKPMESLADNLFLQNLIEKKRAEIQRGISERNAKIFDLEAEKLDSWAEDLKVTLEREIKDMDRQIREAKRAAKIAPTLEEKLAGQKQIKTLESNRNAKRRALFEAQDEIDIRREKLISEIEGKLQQSQSTTEIFRIRWRLN